MFPFHLTDLEQVKHFGTNALFHIVGKDNIHFPKSPKKWSDNQMVSIGLQNPVTHLCCHSNITYPWTQKP